MDYEKIIAELDDEIGRLQRARAALTGSKDVIANGSRRNLSAATRKRMAQAMRARWAKVKKAGKSKL